MGVNTVAHFTIESVEDWHEIGHRLAPKEGIWDDILEQPGTQSLTIQGQRTDGFSGNIHVTVEPSKEVHPGIRLEVNDHFDKRDGNNLPAVTEMMKVLSSEWEACGTRAAAILSKVMRL